MRKSLFSLVFILVFKFGYSQEFKRNQIWSVGYSPPVYFDFSNTVIVDTLEKIGPGLTFGNSCISDTSGKILFFCNGFHIYAKDGWTLNWVNGIDTINISEGKKLYNYYGGDGFFNQMSIILPKKNNSYYVFTTGMSDSAYDDWKVYQTDFRFDVLNYAVVDMDANGGLGKVTSKNNIVMQHARLSHNRMTAVKHGNGVDWWLIKPHQTKQEFNIIRVTSDSVYAPINQSFNYPDVMGLSSNFGQSCFSMQGDYYAHVTGNFDGVFVYQFDRCSGLFSDYHYFPVPRDTCNAVTCDFATGISFSPNGQFLYYNTYNNIWQIDLHDTTASGLFHITGIDMLVNYFPWWGSSALAPNGKIYFGNMNGTLKSIDYIENPDIKGIGCNFRGRGNGAFIQPYTNLIQPPNMPNYGLGGNGLCWPLSNGELILENREWSVYPNPASNNVTIAYKLSATDEAQFVLYEIIGREVKNIKLFQNTTKTSFVVSDLMTGIYAYKYIVNGSLIASGKLSIQ